MQTLERIRDDITAYFGRTKDFPFKLRVEDSILQTRAVILKRDQNKKFSDRQAIQTFIVPLTKRNSTRDSVLQSPFDCQVLEYKDVPEMVNIFKFPFEFVGTINESHSFSYIKPEHVRYHLANPNLANSYFYSYYNNDLLIYFKKTIDRVRVRGVVFDPRDLEKFNQYSTSSEECYDVGTAFPISQHLITDLKKEVINQFSRNDMMDKDLSDEPNKQL